MKFAMKDTKEILSAQTVALHWIVAVGMIAMLAVGWYMERYEVFALYPIHKSVGILLFIAVLARIWWRAANRWPQPAREFARAQLLIARASHWTLIIGTALMPLSGMLMSAAGGRGLKVFGLPLFPSNYNAAGEVTALSEDLAHFAHSTHFYVSRILIAVIALHICAAMKHHFFDKDNVLRRMLGVR